MSQEPVLIDLDVPATRQSNPDFAGRWGRLGRVKVSLLAALGMMVVAGGAGAAVAIYAADRANSVRIVAVSADITADATPRVEFAGGRVRLDGTLKITNIGASPIDVVGLRMDPAHVSIKGTSSSFAVNPGVTSFVPVTMTLTCTETPSPGLNGKASLLVGASVDTEHSGSPIAFDNAEWAQQMMMACVTRGFR